MNKKRNAILAIALMLSTVLITGLTFAYLSAKTTTKNNTFTIGGVSIQLAEPNFDGLGYDGKDTSVTVAQLGEVSALNIVPGRIIDKNPSVNNTSTVPVWIAIKVDYTISDTIGAYDDATVINKLTDFATINFDPTNWAMKTGSDYTIFYYNTSVLPGGYTSDLFKTVTINTSATELKPFTIDVTAYAVQEEGLDVVAAKAQLDSMMD